MERSKKRKSTWTRKTDEEGNVLYFCHGCLHRCTLISECFHPAELFTPSAIRQHVTLCRRCHSTEQRNSGRLRRNCLYAFKFRGSTNSFVRIRLRSNQWSSVKGHTFRWTVDDLTAYIQKHLSDQEIKDLEKKGTCISVHSADPAKPYSASNCKICFNKTLFKKPKYPRP